MHRLRGLVSIAATAVIAAGCASTGDHQHSAAHLGEAMHAVCVLAPTQGSTAAGKVTFDQHGSDVIVTVDMVGLAPNSEHAWHIHEWGDISAADGTAAGGHYNPEGHPHGLPPDPNRHAGDLGNLRADASGHAHKTIEVDNITIAGDRNPIVGRAMIVHAKADDGGQPTGNAGGRIAQGVIGLAKE